ncbi:uncharacterized protein LOC144826139 [Lissotriton helveticus]
MRTTYDFAHYINQSVQLSLITLLNFQRLNRGIPARQYTLKNSRKSESILTLFAVQPRGSIDNFYLVLLLDAKQRNSGTLSSLLQQPGICTRLNPLRLCSHTVSQMVHPSNVACYLFLKHRSIAVDRRGAEARRRQEPEEGRASSRDR